MKHIQELVRIPTPIWSVNISDDPITGLNRTFESDGLYIASWGITLRGSVFFKDAESNTITAGRYKPYKVELTAGLDETGPFVDPTDGHRVYPNEFGEVPDNTILRYDALMYKLTQNVNIDSEVRSFVVAADLNKEFDL